MNKIRLIMVTNLIAILLLVFITNITVRIMAQNRGYQGTVTIQNQYHIMSSNLRNHIVDKNYEPKDGDIVIYVRYGCSVCEALHDEINALQKEYDYIHIIGTRTGIGERLQEAYPTDLVPSAVLIGSKQSYVSLATTDEDGHTVLNKTALDTLQNQREELICE